MCFAEKPEQVKTVRADIKSRSVQNDAEEEHRKERKGQREI